MEESLRGNELKFIGYQNDIRNVLDLDPAAEEEISDHPYYSHNNPKKGCKEVYDPFQYQDPYFRYKYNEPKYEVADNCNDKKHAEPCGFYSTASHGYPNYNDKHRF